MNTVVFTFTLICTAVAFDIHIEDWDVGTVLFSRASMKKRSWTASQMAVLRARKHFLELLPPIYTLNTQSEDFTKTMLTYFNKTFTEVNNAETDPETKKMLKIALSDTIGGYIKMWVMPITKFAYYGGTVKPEDALRLYQFHDDLKKYLKTNGSGWRNPSADYLYSMSVNVAPINQYYSRKPDYPCDNISYFERTKSGLVIPVPSISWEKGYECMFFPLKNQGPVFLHDQSDSLVNYYNLARYCILSSDIEDIDCFEERFQMWLEKNVIPHLKDDKLYPALRNVLALVNKSRVYTPTAEAFVKVNSKTHIAGVPIDFSSKKMVVIAIIIVLEIAWCIPTLCYLLFTRRKKTPSKLNLCQEIINDVDEEPPPPPPPPPPEPAPDGLPKHKCSCSTITNPIIMSSKQVSAAPSVKSIGCIRQQNVNCDADVEACFPKASQTNIGTGTSSNFRCQQQPAETMTSDQGICVKPSKQLGSISKSVSIQICTQSSSDKPASSARPFLMQVYDSSNKTSVNSFTRYKIKKEPISLVNPVTNRSPSCEGDAYYPFIPVNTSQREVKKNSSHLIPKASSQIAKKCSSSSFITNSCGCKVKKESYTKACCSDPNCDCFNCIPEEDLGSKTISLATVQNLQPTQTVTLLQDDLPNFSDNTKVNDFKASSYINFLGIDNIESRIANRERSKSKINFAITSIASSQDQNSIKEPMESHKIDNGIKKSVTIASINSSHEVKHRKPSKNLPSKQSQCVAIEKASKETMIYAAYKLKSYVHPDANVNKKDLRSAKQSVKRSIDRSFPSSSVENSVKSSKPSKIPKRFFTNNLTQTKYSKIYDCSHKSMIPKRKKYLTVDDIGISSEKSSLSSEKEKLNVTL